MKVIAKELYLGAALTQIVESFGFVSMRKASHTVGHYEINDSRRLFVRYTKSERGPWSFSFRPRDLELIQEELGSGLPFFLGLVCGNTATCLLTVDQLVQVLDIQTLDAQSIRVHTRPRASLNVSGSGGRLNDKVLLHAFPGGVFQ